MLRNRFVAQCVNTNLILNMKKTNEIIVDLKWIRDMSNYIPIMWVYEYKY